MSRWLAFPIVGLLGPTLAAATSVPVAHHGIEAELDVPAHRVSVRDVVELARSLDSDEPWRFLLHRDLAVEAIRFGDVELEWSEPGGWNPRHFWARPPYADLGRFEIAREVQVRPPSGGWGTEPPRFEIRYAGVIADSLHSPDRAYGRSFETTTGRIVEKGAYLDGGTHWVPWSGDDPFRFELTVRSPPDWRVVSEGDLAGDDADSASRTTRWVSEQPMEEIHLIAGPYRVRRREYGGVDILTYCYENTGDDITDPYLEAAGESIDRFAEWFGPYPFSKFALVENYWQTGYGMPSFTFLGDRVIRLPFIVYTSYPHEILHNWWGNGVYVAWEQGNWCEGLTTYCADYMAKERESEAAARDYRRTTLTAYRDFAVGGGEDFALVQFRERDSAATQAVGYGKTLMVFHMLRRRLGDEAFFAALRRLFEEKRFQRASWDDVRESFRAENGPSLHGWIEPWIVRPGAPHLSLRLISVTETEAGYEVRGAVHQAPPAYGIQVPVVLTGGDERKEWLMASSTEEAEFTMTSRFRPERLAADPDFHLFRLLHAEEVPPALSGVLGAPAVRVVVGEEVAGELREALLAVGREWAEDSTVTLVETTGEPLADFDGGTWLFGAGRAAADFVASLGGRVGETGSFVGAGRLDGDAARPAAVWWPEGAESVAAIARKIPHYSKYGFLVFEGERNVDKGSWDTGESPLVVDLDWDES